MSATVSQMADEEAPDSQLSTPHNRGSLVHESCQAQAAQEIIESIYWSSSTEASVSSNKPTAIRTSDSSRSYESSVSVYASARSTFAKKRTGKDLKSEVPSKKQCEEENTGPMSQRDVLVQCAMMVVSKPVEFSKNLSSLVALMYCMQNSTPRQWAQMTQTTSGLVSLSDPKSLATGHMSAPFSPSQHASVPAVAQPKHHPLRGVFLTLSNEVVLLLGELVFVRHVLNGCGICVVRANVINNCPQADEWKGKSIVVKLSFISETRTPEAETLSEILEIANNPQADHTWVLKRLPDILHYEAVRLKPNGTDTRSAMSEHLEYIWDQYKNQALQILVMTELFPITQLKNSDELVPVIRDVFKCYRWLYEHAKVIHRDISPGNIMYRKETNEDGSIAIYGVLADYDLALFFEKPKERSGLRIRGTGTQPHMATDLLEFFPPKHLYRHDLESLFYVIVIYISHYDGGKEINNPPLKGWFTLTRQISRIVKLVFFTCDVPPQPTSDFQNMYALVMAIHSLFTDGYAARQRHWRIVNMWPKTAPLRDQPKFDDSTLGGYVNFDKFQAVLDEPFEPLSPP